MNTDTAADAKPHSDTDDEPRTALLIVDVQPTFCEGGELPVAGGNAIAAAIAAWLPGVRDRYDLVVTSQDWHIDPGAHFSDTPDLVDTWPPHGLAGTPNASLHPAIAHLADDPTVVAIRKGHHAAAYSAFDGTTEDGRSLRDVLDEHRITAAHVVGLAASHCVAETAIDAAAAGLATSILTDLTVGVTEELTAGAYRRARGAGVQLIDSVQGG